MSTALNQIIDDTSPVVTYTPSISTDPFTDDVGAQKAQEEGWIVQFDNKNFLVGASVLGNGTSDHLTSRDGAGFGFDFTGSSIMLLGRALGTIYDISLDSNSSKSLSPIQNTTDPSGNPMQILYQVANLSSGVHRLDVVVHTSKGVDGGNVFESFFSFDYASVGVNVDADPDQLSITLIPDTILSFSGSWTFQQSQGPFLLSGTSTLWGTSIVTFHQTGITGDQITLTLPFLQSDAFTVGNPAPRVVGLTVVGIVGEGMSLYNVSIKSSHSDSRDFSSTLNSTTPFLTATNLFLASDLSSLLGIPGQDPGNVTVQVINGDNTPLRVAGFNVSSILAKGESGGGGEVSTLSG